MRNIRNKLAGLLRHISRHTQLEHRSTERRGVVLLAVLVFIALLLPLITLVLTSINTETVATAEAIKGAKAEMAAEKAVNDAISLVVQEKGYPDFYTSAYQEETAIATIDPETGARRDQILTGSLQGSGADDVFGTEDDYWTGPRRDGSYVDSDDNFDPNNYNWDFTFPSLHGPTYIGQSWSFSTDYLAYARSQNTGDWIWLFNQFAAAEDSPADGLMNGYTVEDPFAGGTEDGYIYGPGYFSGADEPRSGGAGGPVLRDLSAAGIDEALFNSKVNVYQSIYSDLDRGPIPSGLLKSFANVSDEAGRINLNIFCKKIPVFMPESAETDYDLDGYGTNDFSLNNINDEEMWKWVDNPLFPDRDTTYRYDFDFLGSGGFTALGPLDWGRLEQDELTDDQDDIAMPELGETVQHYYAGDLDGDGIPDSIESCRRSLEMLMSIPGVTPLMAAQILTYLNPPHDVDNGSGMPGYEASTDTWPLNQGYYRTLHYDYHHSGTTPEPDPENGDYRLDACNITPPLIALRFSESGGVVTDYYWDMQGGSEASGLGSATSHAYDDMPLPPPRPFSSLEELREIPSLSDKVYNRLEELVTVFSYDTNVIANYIQDVSYDTDLLNPYAPGDPEYNGAAVATVPEFLRDDDNVPDLRFDVDRYVGAATLADYRTVANSMFAHVRAHMPTVLRQKVTLPVVDRMGRAGAEDHMVANDDLRYDGPVVGTSMLIPHRDTQERPYNVGASGHQYEVAGNDGAGYPALNPSFSLDSCLSILMYRNGTLIESDDYTYNPDGGAWQPNATRGLDFLFGGNSIWILQLLGPFANLLGDFTDNNNPSATEGYNVNADVRPHGPGLFDPRTGVADYANLVNPGSLDSAADLLDVPLYDFSSMSVGLMADPPSGFRYDLNGDNEITWGIPEEIAPVSYYASFSDVVDAGWYMANVHPDGPDDRPGTGDEPDQNIPLYMLRFNIGNRPDVWGNPDWGNDPLQTIQIPLTAAQLRAVGGGVNGSSSKITLVAYDNFNNLDVISYRFFQAARGPYASLSIWSGDNTLYDAELAFRRNFGWDDIPEPTGSIFDPTSDDRPVDNSYWDGGGLITADNDPDISGRQFPGSDERQAWAFDTYGDPYLTARVEAVRWDAVNDQEAEPNLRADEVCQVYLQYNEDADIPLRADILPVRVSGDRFEVRSSVGGASVDGGTYLLYDWELNGDPLDPDDPSWDGTWPNPQPWQRGDPRVIRVTPEATNQVYLRIYDLRVFQDNSGGAYLPLGPGVTQNLRFYGPPVVVPGDDNVQAPPNFPADPAYGGTYPTMGVDPGYAEARAEVTTLPGATFFKPQVTALEPAVYSDDNSTQFRASAVGGEMPYSYRLRIFPGTDIITEAPAINVNAITFSDALPPYPSFDGGQAAEHNAANLLLERNVASSNDIEELFTINAAALYASNPMQYYWVELQVAESSGLTTPKYAYTVLQIGDEGAPGGSYGDPPEMNASINVRPLTEVVGAGGRKGFVCSAAVDGGTGGYNYRWEVHRPQYSKEFLPSGNPNPDYEPNKIIDVEVVDAAAPFVNIDTENPGSPATVRPVQMVSNEPNPTFEFHTFDLADNDTGAMGGDGVPDADGVYFIHCYVMDKASFAAGSASSIVAHDVAMVKLNDSGGIGAADSLSRTPMALLHAAPPGNTAVDAATNTRSPSGNQPWIEDLINDVPIEPPTAAAGQTVIVRGRNFVAPVSPMGTNPTGVASDNEVTFAGGASARAFAIVNEGPVDTDGDSVDDDIQWALYVSVPEGAQTGYLTVTTDPSGAGNGGTSEREYFQTGFTVTFDLIGSLSSTNVIDLTYWLDVQGDGEVDFGPVTKTGTGTDNGIIRGEDYGISYDYARDGFGNYNATLYVKDNTTGRHAVSHQLVTIKDKRLQGDHDNGMMLSIWPDVDMRNETFTSDPSDGVTFQAAAGGSPGANLTYKWSVNRNIATGLSTGGDTILSGVITQTYNPTPARPRATLIDNSPGTNFLDAGTRGVSPEDLVMITERDDDGAPPDPPPGSGNGCAIADVYEVLDANELTLLDPADPGDLVPGLHSGSEIVRTGTIGDVAAGPVADSFILIDDRTFSVPDDYEWVGDTIIGGTEGGLDVGDTITDVNTGVDWEVLATSDNANGYGVALDVEEILVGNPSGSGLIDAHVVLANPPAGGGPWTQTIVLIDPVSGTPLLNPAISYASWIGRPVYNLDDGNGEWTITAVSGPTSSITVSSEPSATRPFIGGAPPAGDDIQIDVPPTWLIGENWRCVIPPNELRKGFDYSIFSSDGTSAGSWADASYANAGAPIDFTIRMQYPFDLNTSPANPSRVEVAWTGDFGDGYDTYYVGNTTRLDGAQNGLELEWLRLTYAFTSNNKWGVPDVDVNPANGIPDWDDAGHGMPTQAAYRVITTPLGKISPTTYGPYALPRVIVGGDDVDYDLVRLNVNPANHDSAVRSVHPVDDTAWDNDRWNQVGAEINILRDGLYYSASDQMVIPPGMGETNNSLTTWLSLSKPFIISNSFGSTNVRHQAVHGQGASYNWLSDGNADTIWHWSNPGLGTDNWAYESPTGANTAYDYEFQFQNDTDRIPVPPDVAVLGRGGFPRSVPGIMQTGVSGDTTHFRAQSGIFNSFGFITESLPLADRAFVFDSQPIMWGDREELTAPSEVRPIGADFYAEPLVGANTQPVRLRSFVTGGSSSFPTYNYQWFIYKLDNGDPSSNYTGWVGVQRQIANNNDPTSPNINDPSATSISPAFNPARDVTIQRGSADSGAGNYRVYLRVTEVGGSAEYWTCYREFEVKYVPLSVNGMASPPSTSTGAEVAYFAAIDGGTPPYDVEIDWDYDGTFDVRDAVYDTNAGEVSFENIFFDEGTYEYSIRVTDDAGADVYFHSTQPAEYRQVVVADIIPLNATLLATPASGVAPFQVDVHYAVSGGQPFSNNEYNVNIMLMNTNGMAEYTVSRDERNTFGANGVLDDPRLPTSDDRPVELIVPEAGNYFVQLTVTDNAGNVKSVQENIYANGYLVPSEYGSTTPQVVRDQEGRPMHAVRVWVDPFLNIDENSTDSFENIRNADGGGGRLMEADLQVLGDLFMTDPNNSFRSLGMHGTDDPLSQPLYYADYTLDSSGEDRIQDFYDTFTMGRINLNTASEQVLTALFSRIIKTRRYLLPDDEIYPPYSGSVSLSISDEVAGNEFVDLELDNDASQYEQFRYVRVPELDEYLSLAEARELAQLVIRYRNMYYDLHKPDMPDADDQVGYQKAANPAGDPDYAGLGSSFMVDHLPVIGPWDGVNPNQYEYDDRDAELADVDSGDIRNAWDHLGATYYNIDGAEAPSFYSPTDIAVVRDRWRATLSLTLPDGSTIPYEFVEPDSNYAKYLNDVSHNQLWSDDRDSEFGAWFDASTSESLMYQIGDYYSDWAFDARHYMTYAGGEFVMSATVDASGDFTVNPPTAIPGSGGTPADARNRMGFFQTNGITAHSYIPNPPFRHIFDLFKVIVTNSGEASELYGSTDDPSVNPWTYSLTADTDGILEVDAATQFSESTRVFSGPSAFRYEALWDDLSCEYLPVANYLDDIAPYLTTRSYVYRVEGSGAVEASGGTASAVVDTARISRDRSKLAIIDVGPMWARRDSELLRDVFPGAGESIADGNLSYRMLWYKEGQ